MYEKRRQHLFSRRLPFKGQFEVHLYTKLICPLQSMAQGMAKSGRITSDLKCMKLYWQSPTICKSLT